VSINLCKMEKENEKRHILPNFESANWNIYDTLWLGLDYPYKESEVQQVLDKLLDETGYKLDGINAVPIDYEDEEIQE
jgi:hypothetical protein